LADSVFLPRFARLEPLYGHSLNSRKVHNRLAKGRTAV
jgi:hypothetical protein